ncbi:MAG: polyprenyl synthetase family protein [Bacteroidales bacterium]|nr:polyprenyl synthetase family protein [Bacteroidales bacterium]
MVNEFQISDMLTKLFGNISFSDTPAGLYDPLRYMIALGGKQIRPRLCLTTYALYKDKFGDDILQPAAALEVFHNFTLIHDDIMDHSPIRRGQPTVWNKWGDDTAILSGDVMCIDSYKRIAKAPAKVLPQVMELFSKTAAQVCEGQQMDMDFEVLSEVPMSDYMEMIGLKTGVLIACAAKMGALIGGASGDDCEKLYNYGYTLGLAFQVADDFLDAYGNEATFGKPIGGDIVNNKKSWLTTRALEKADEILHQQILDIEDLPVDTSEEKAFKIARMKDLYEKLHIEEDAKYEIIRLTDQALGYAATVCTGVRYEILRRFAERLVGRVK